MEVRSFDAVRSENFYLKRFGLGNNRISEPPPENLHLVVTIPSFKEPNLVDAVKSIQNCLAPNVGVEVLVLINQAENADEKTTEENERSVKQLSIYLKESKIKYPTYLLKDYNLPKKHAGVGLARKILMDEAVYRLEAVGNKNGIIVCFDADAVVSENYLVAIKDYFTQNPKCKAAGINFEHPFEALPKDEIQRKAIVEYELHLRYYINALRWSGHPFAFQTIGSSMMVKNDVYQAYGGMNKRKAGEDFYFLQKIIPDGDFGQINNATVFPSCRVSDRVPFGTGKAVGEYLKTGTIEYHTYNFEIFKYLKSFWNAVPEFFKNSVGEFEANIRVYFPLIANYLDESNQWEMFDVVKSNSSTLLAFQKRFFKWMNAFQALKLIHFLESKFDKSPILNEANKLAENLNNSMVYDVEELLINYRSWDKKNPH